MKSYSIQVKQVAGQWQLFHEGNGQSANSVSVPGGEQGLFAYKIVSSSGVKFVNDHPIWIQDSTAKPKQAVVDSQITDLSAGGKTDLSFTDLNHGSPTTLTYSLHFSDGSVMDPIINNGGGSSPPPPPPPPPLAATATSESATQPQQSSSSYSSIAIYVAIGFVLGFLIAWLLKRR